MTLLLRSALDAYTRFERDRVAFYPFSRADVSLDLEYAVFRAPLPTSPTPIAFLPPGLPPGLGQPPYTTGRGEALNESNGPTARLLSWRASCGHDHPTLPPKILLLLDALLTLSAEYRLTVADTVRFLHA